MRPLVRAFPVALLILASSSTVSSGAGGSPRQAFASPRVAPEARSLFAHRARTGRTLPVFAPNPAFEQTGRLPVVVRFVSAPTSERRERLVQAGVAFDRAEPTASGAWLATVDERGLGALAQAEDVARVTVDMFHANARPLDRSMTETRAAVAKRAAIAKDGERLDGKGTVIADIDSPIWIHHPAFFRADGGALPWVDVDGDKKLTPGVDGVDLDESGSIEPNEVLQPLRSKARSRYTGATIDEHDDFQPDVDYLYLDTNGNGTRDHGTKFDEATPAYGEPLFVFDDANHDGRTQPSERVLRLGTSKIRSVASDGKTYARGAKKATSTTAPLVRYDVENDPTLVEAAGHATGVMGILAGGQPGISRWVGLAPDAEVILHDSTGLRGMATAVQWAIDEKANVILTEYAPYTNVSLDGSSEEETILDAANAKGILTVSPAGNLAGGRKHRTITLQPGANTVKLGTKTPGHLASISLHHRGPERALSLVLKKPDGATVALPDDAPDGIAQGNGVYLYVTKQTTPRGTHERFVNLVSQGFVENPLDGGAYELAITLDGGAPLEVDLFSGDDVSSWAGGFSFDEDTPTRTLCNPATSDATISVAAYVLHDEKDFYPAGPAGALASYSSRGPRFDGAAGIEIAAPDNPLSTAPPDPRAKEESDRKSALWEPFGGTSGAGPHVAAAVALAMQALPKASADEIKKRLLEGARREDAASESTMGHGKLDIARALDANVADGAVPKVKLEAIGGGKARVTAEDDEPETALRVRWDLDYDGTFDTEWMPLGESPEGLTPAVKVEVRDGQGNVGGATALLDLAAPAPAAPPPPAADADDGCGCRAAGAERSPIAAFGGAFAIALAALVRRRRGRSS